jgi:hypothetical protein
MKAWRPALLILSVAAGSWLLFAIPRLFLGLAPWYRLPVIRGVIYDTPMYLTWINYLKAGIPFANNVSWYKYFITFFDGLTFGQASAAELYLMAYAVSVLLLAWVIKRTLLFLTRDKRLTWILGSAWWLLFALHMAWRPAAYSWYLPFGIGAVALVLYAFQETRKAWRYGALVAAVISASLYPWFLIPVALWAGSLAAHDLVLASRGWSTPIFVWLGGVLASVFGIVLFISRISGGRLEALVDLFTRYGLAWTRLPFLTTAILVPLFWLGCLILLLRRFPTHQGRILPFLWGWLIIFFCFEFSPFTGIVFQNDHFRTITLILSWLSGAFVLHLASEESEVSALFSKKGWIGTLGLVLTLVSFLMVFWKGGEFLLTWQDLSFVQFVFWLPVATSFFVLRFTFSPRHMSRIVLVVCAAMGLVGGVSVFVREFSDLHRLRQQQIWQKEITRLVPEGEYICTDPVSADRVAPSVPRLVMPAVTYRFFPESDVTQFDFLARYVSVFDLSHAPQDQREMMEHVVRQDRYITCVHGQWFEKIASRIGVEQKTVDRVTGCPRKKMEEDWKWLRAASEVPSSAEGIRLLSHTCSWILMTPGNESLWRVPETYPRTSIGDGGTLVDISF